MPHYGIVIDLRRCVGCRTCELACRQAFATPLPRARLAVQDLGPAHTSAGLTRTFHARQCVHCAQPACVTVCPVAPRDLVVTGADGNKTIIQARATWKEPATGIVRIDPDRCIGCGACVDACPYEARFLLERPNGGRRADGCDLCWQRLANGDPPVCVEACLTDARLFGDLDTPTSAAGRLAAAGGLVLEPPDAPTGPAVWYIGRKQDLELLRRAATPASRPIPPMRRRLLSMLVR